MGDVDAGKPRLHKTLYAIVQGQGSSGAARRWGVLISVYRYAWEFCLCLTHPSVWETSILYFMHLCIAPSNHHGLYTQQPHIVTNIDPCCCPRWPDREGRGSSWCFLSVSAQLQPTPLVSSVRGQGKFSGLL